MRATYLPPGGDVSSRHGEVLGILDFAYQTCIPYLQTDLHTQDTDPFYRTTMPSLMRTLTTNSCVLCEIQMFSIKNTKLKTINIYTSPSKKAY